MKLRQSLFWDTDPKRIDLKKNARYVIERVMDFGRDDEVRWLWRYYDKSLMREVVTKSRSLRPETKALWTLLLQTA
ncbi:MAG: hypothetical protein KGI49_02695 [Patescibacteria group bacterium]|nr:hypothetical protein [Patescibacteria group bacterium]